MGKLARMDRLQQYGKTLEGYSRRTLLEEPPVNGSHAIELKPVVSAPNSDSEDAQQVRKSEENKAWFRVSRFYCLDNAWFFSTREGIDLGPYVTKQDAERELNLLVKMLAKTSGTAEAVFLIHEFYNRPSCGLPSLHEPKSHHAKRAARTWMRRRPHT